MLKYLKALLLSAALLASGMSLAATEGKEFKKMAAPRPVAQAGKLEVIEFFWYGCPHCQQVEPFVEAWAAKLPKDVNFRRIHAVWPGRSDLEAHARIFVTLQSMGLDAKYQQAVFNAVQRDNIELRKEKNLYDWVQKQGIDVNKFKAAYNSFSMAVSLKKLEQMTVDYLIDGVPTFIVNGKYVTSPAMVGREDGTVLSVIDSLLAQERKALPSAKK